MQLLSPPSGEMWQGAKMLFLYPAFRWKANWMEVNYKKMGPGMKWDANILYWIEVKLCMNGGETIIIWPGCRWGRTWMDLRCTSWDLYGFEMGSECSWDIVIPIWMELRRHLNEGETRILEPVFMWDSTWMEMKRKFSKSDWLGVMPGLNWYAVFRTRMEVIQT